MKTLGALRIVAYALAAIGVLDPAFEMTSSAPTPVALHLDRDAPDAAAAATVAQRLIRDLAGDVTFNGAAAPVGQVAIGSAAQGVTDGVPASTVMLSPRSGTAAVPNVRLVSIASPASTPVGWAATFDVTIEGTGMASKGTTLVLERQGVELARAEHKWSRAEERATVTLTFAPPSAGVSRVTIRAVPFDGEQIRDDNAADARLSARSTPLAVLVHEPRPSWAAAFVRRALEENATFQVSTSVRPSRGLFVRAGVPPRRIHADELEPFDAVVIGAPEDLVQAEVDALSDYARRRGGAVVLLPDRRPSGRYLDLLPVTRFDEMLVEHPVDLTSRHGALRAGELSVPRDGAAGTVLASFQAKERAEPVVSEWTMGGGRVLFSGALDAWRFRAARENGFARFWQATIAQAALSSPPAIELSTLPEVARPGELVTLRATVRTTEIANSADGLRVPALRGRLIGLSGAEQVVRMWPAGEPGVFEGRFHAPDSGNLDVQVTSGDATADLVLLSDADVRHVSLDARAVRDRAEAVAASTGGVAVDATDMSALTRWLQSLAHEQVLRTVRPGRSLWLVLAFATLLCTEWALRRRRGLR